MDYKNRVLGPNGFESFPERLMNKEIERGNVPAPQDAGDPKASDLPEHGKQGKQAVLKEQAIQKAAQDYYNKNVAGVKRDLTLELKDSEEKSAKQGLVSSLGKKIAEAKAKAEKK